ncbi:MAG: hypothetical protein HRT87_07400 [Legionellales bacterium]|nr:hypothetical protein [Legionellales bacterium]
MTKIFKIFGCVFGAIILTYMLSPMFYLIGVMGEMTIIYGFKSLAVVVGAIFDGLGWGISKSIAFGKYIVAAASSLLTMLYSALNYMTAYLPNFLDYSSYWKDSRSIIGFIICLMVFAAGIAKIDKKKVE